MDMPMPRYRVVVTDHAHDGKAHDYAAYATQWEACAIADALNRAGAPDRISAEVWVIQIDGTRKRLRQMQRTATAGGNFC